MASSTTQDKRILLVLPRPPGPGTSNDAMFPFPFLSLPQIAASVPESYRLRIIDERITAITGKEDTDLVFISILTAAAPRAYELCRLFKRRGIPVVVGGVHASVRFREAAQHATSVAVGEADELIGRIISDFENASLAPFYQADGFPDLDRIPLPAIALLNWRHKVFLSSIQTSRGCPRSCDFCSVPGMSGRRLRFKSLPAVEKELKVLSRFRQRRLFVVDDNFTLVKERALAIAELFRRYRFRWMGFSNLSVSEDESFLRALARSGCVSLFVGFESLSGRGGLAKNHKYGRPDEIRRAVDRIHAHRIGIQGSFIFGFDEDTPEVFDETTAFIQESGIELPHISILTPFPGTPLFDDLERDGRLLHEKWGFYDMNHAVFRPRNMTHTELQQGYVWALKYLASPSSILSRLKRHPGTGAYFLTANFSLHRYQTRLALSLWNRKVQRSLQEKGLCPC